MSLPPLAPALLAVAAGCCVLLAGAGVRLLLVPAFDVPALAQVRAAGRRGPVSDRFFARIGRPVLPVALRLTRPPGRQRLVARLAAAGRLSEVTVEEFLACRAGGVVAGGVAGGAYLLTGSALLGPVIAGVLAGRADLLLWSAARRRQEEIERTLPDVLDVLTVTILAGASFRLGLARVARAFRGALAEELTTTIRQLGIGIGRRQAFAELRERNTSPSLRRFVAGVLQAEELGSSLADTLSDLATDVRRLAAQHARRQADAADKTIAVITTLVLLPAMILMVLSVFFGAIHVGG